MNILADRHHAGLYRSLQYLFEARLGGTLYTPRGREWWDAGVWRFGEVYGDDRLAQQYLEHWPSPVISDGEFPDARIRGVTLAAAEAMDWDVVCATVQENQQGFADFARRHGARYVVAVGNTGQYIEWGLHPLVLNSSEMPIVGSGIDIGQEFDDDGIFAFAPLGDPYRIGSFVNLMPRIDCYPILQRTREALPEFTFRIHGTEGPDGILKPIDAIADAMRACGWGWQDKAHGDGFGHVIHYWAALGRPLIGHASHYDGKRAEHLWVDGDTCIDLDRHSFDDALALIREISADPERHAAMGRAIRQRYDESTDWAGDAQAVAELLELDPVAV